jgi:hypothetical protein
VAQVIALRASAWMQQAAATLPSVWRENYPARAPVLQALQPAVRASLLSPPAHGGRPLAGPSG